VNFIEAIITTIIFVSLFLTIRKLVRGKISAKIQYTLWLIVAVKLLTVFIPMPESNFSIMNIQTYLLDRIETKEDTQKPDTILQNEKIQNTIATDNVNTMVSEKEHIVKQFFITKDIILSNLWKLYLLGIGLILTKIILDNSRLYGFLKNNRVKYNSLDSILPVYLVDGLETPFLYGRSIYIPTKLAADQRKMKHILAHENCHYMQGDYIWGLVREICLTLHWYNPLIWIAVKYAKQDAELACDERSIKCLGENERISYAETLVNLIISQHHVKDLLALSTSMSGNKKGIRERIIMITKKPKTLLSVLVFTVISILAVGCTTFTQGDSNTEVVESQETKSINNEDSNTEVVESQETKSINNEDSNTSETTTGETGYEWFTDGKVYQRADGTKIHLGFSDIADANEVTSYVSSDGTVVNDGNDTPLEYLICALSDNDTDYILSMYVNVLADSNEDYYSYIYEEGEQKIIINYYYQTDTIQITDTFNDDKDFSGEYK